MEHRYNTEMFSFRRTAFAAATAALGFSLFAGCKTTAPKQPARPAVSTVETNQPFAPQVKQLDSGNTMATNILTWDAVAKQYRAKPGELKAPFSFHLKNVSPNSVTIYDTSTSCDCTVAKLPFRPWVLPSGASGEIDATIDLSNKVGTVTNSIIVFTSQGNRRLWVKAVVPESR